MQIVFQCLDVNPLKATYPSNEQTSNEHSESGPTERTKETDFVAIGCTVTNFALAMIGQMSEQSVQALKQYSSI